MVPGIYRHVFSLYIWRFTWHEIVISVPFLLVLHSDRMLFLLLLLLLLQLLLRKMCTQDRRWRSSGFGRIWGCRRRRRRWQTRRTGDVATGSFSRKNCFRHATSGRFGIRRSCHSHAAAATEFRTYLCKHAARDQWENASQLFRKCQIYRR